MDVLNSSSSVTLVSTGGKKEYQLSAGKIIQGGAGEVTKYYADVMKEDSKIILINCAKRSGVKAIKPILANVLYEFPMSEADKEKACAKYLKDHGSELVKFLENDYTLVINCQEGLHRSAEFAKQLLSLIDC